MPDTKDGWIVTEDYTLLRASRVFQVSIESAEGEAFLEAWTDDGAVALTTGTYTLSQMQNAQVVMAGLLAVGETVNLPQIMGRTREDAKLPLIKMHSSGR